MRRALYSTVAVIATLFPMQSMAADISEAGARDITERLTHYLPADIVDTGFLKVTAGANRYELSVDLEPLLAKIPKDQFSISGLRPFVHYLTPQDDGLWKVESNDHLNVSGQFSLEGKKQSFTYIIEKMALEGMFDPSITYFTTGHYNLDKLSIATDTAGAEKVAATIDSIVSDMKSDKVGEGFIDLTSTMEMKNLVETITDPTAGVVDITAASMTGDVKAEKLGIVALRDLVVFALDKVKAQSDKLTPEEDAKLKALIKANVPFVDNLVENIKVHDVKVKAQGLEGGVEELGYKIEFNGIKADTRAGFEFSVANPVVPAGLLPPGTEAAVPQTASMGVAVTGLNVEGVVSYLLENADFTKADPLTPAQSTELGKIVLPGGLMNVEFYNVAALSAVYDLALWGTMQVNPDDSSKPRADITITARDLDKTVKYLQDNSKTVPEFGQASFVLLMMKGFGDAKADGSMVWNVKLDEAGKVTVNGREMPH
jgi:hypothetical protein